MNAKELGEQSAYPVMPPQDSSGAGSAGGYPFPMEGMTKREAFAMAAMQALLASGKFETRGDDVFAEAVYCADQQLAALAEPQA